MLSSCFSEPEDSSGGLDAEDDTKRARTMLALSIMTTRTKREKGHIGDDKHLVHPLSEFHQLWDLFMTVLICITVVTVPLALGWTEINRNMFEFNITIDLLFMLDIAKNFRTGVINENDVIVMDVRLIRNHYLKRWFTIDLLSSFPLDLVLILVGADPNEDEGSGGGASESKSSLRTLKILRLLRIAKMMRLMRVSKVYKLVRSGLVRLLERLKIKIPDFIVKFAKLGTGMLLLAHWIGCLNFMMCRLYKNDQGEFPASSWVVNSNLQHASVGTQYSWTMFKALCAMLILGFEGPPFTNVTCETRDQWCTIEHWTVLLCLWIGAIFYAMLVSSMTSIIASMNIARRRYEEKLTQVKEYMSFKKLPGTLRDRVRQYFELKFNDGKVFDEEVILADLTPNLRQEILRFLSASHLLKVPVLKSSPSSLVERLGVSVEPLIVFAEETVLHEGHHGDTLLIVNSGIIEISTLRTRHLYRSVTDGCSFGDVAVLLNTKRTATCKAKMQSTLYTLTGTTLRETLLDYPEVCDYMTYIARRRQLRVQLLDAAYVPTDAQSDISLDGLDVDEEDMQTDIFSDPTTLSTINRMQAMQAMEDVTAASGALAGGGHRGTLNGGAAGAGAGGARAQGSRRGRPGLIPQASQRTVLPTGAPDHHEPASGSGTQDHLILPDVSE